MDPQTILEPLDTRALRILERNNRHHMELSYTVPRPGLYPFQWNWDSAFTALGLSRFDEKRAWWEVDTLMKGQWDNGMLPHIIYHTNHNTYCPGPDYWRCKNAAGVKTSGISNPPVLAFVVRKMVEGAKDRSMAHFHAGRLFPKIYNWHHWWHTKRDPDGSGLVSAYHPWETGRDNSHDWAEAMENVHIEELEEYERKDTGLIPADERPVEHDYDVFMKLVQDARKHGFDDDTLANDSSFHVKDTTINFVLARADRDLLWLAQHLMTFEPALDFSVEVEQLRKWVSAAPNALEKLWNKDEHMYQPINVLTSNHAGGVSSAGFLAPLAGLTAHDDLLAERIESWHKQSFLIASYDPEVSDFDPKRYWRGPIWAIVNYMIYDGFMVIGNTDIARKIAVDTIICMQNNGMAEYYHPKNGKGLGGDGFSWTAAMWLHWLSPMVEMVSHDIERRRRQIEKF